LGDASMPLYRDVIAGFFGGSASEAEFLLDSQAFWNSLLLLPEDLDEQDRVYRALHRPDDPLGLRPVASHLVMEVLPARYFGAPLGSRRGYKQRGSMIMELVEDAYFPARLTSWLPGATGLLTPVQRQLQTLAADAGNVRLRRLEEASVTIPVDFGDLSWKQILRLRRSRSWQSFLSRLDDWTAREGASTQQALARELVSVTEDLIPSRTSIVAATAANVLPPLGWALTAQATRERWILERKQGWLLFMLEVRRRTSR
jgi:hypothetical protein